MGTTLDLIRAIESGNSRLSQSTFEELVQTRVAEAIDTRRTEIAQSMFQPIEEAVDSNGTNLGRVIAKHENGNRVAKVYNNREWGEHVVQFHEGGKHLKDADYHTDDKEDAHDTAKHWVSKANESVELTVEAIEEMSEEEFKNLVENMDQLNELSKATLARYVKKAHFEGGLADFRHGVAVGNSGNYSKRPDKKTAKANAVIANKRMNGIDKAVDRLAK